MSMKKMLAVVAAAALVAISAPAFAANPFMDVPMNHWAYDAVEKLAAAGVIEGYPDGSFKGQKPITRYEMSMMVARAMASGGLGGEDGALLKRLIVEFKDELDALGVKVDGMDARLTDLEKGVGGWKFWGELRMDAKWFDKDAYAAAGFVKPGDGMTMSRYRLWLSKKVDENITFTGRWNGAGAAFDRWYFDVNEFIFGGSLRAGRFNFDWEDEDGLYADGHDAYFTDVDVTGFQYKKDFSFGQFAGLVVTPKDASSADAFLYGARFKINPSEKFWLSLNGFWFDEGAFGKGFSKGDAYYGALGFKFIEGVELKGAYYYQDFDGFDSAKAWKAVLDVKQDVLKFTSLWVEYADLDKGFLTTTDAYNAYDFAVFSANKMPLTAIDDTKVLAIRADQKWTDQWSTFGRYVKADNDVADARNWTVGVKYQYTPALSFELMYDDISYNNGAEALGLKDDNLIRFRTHLKF